MFTSFRSLLSTVTPVHILYIGCLASVDTSMKGKFWIVLQPKLLTAPLNHWHLTLPVTLTTKSGLWNVKRGTGPLALSSVHEAACLIKAPADWSYAYRRKRWALSRGSQSPSQGICPWALNDSKLWGNARTSCRGWALMTYGFTKRKYCLCRLLCSHTDFWTKTHL